MSVKPCAHTPTINPKHTTINTNPTDLHTLWLKHTQKHAVFTNHHHHRLPNPPNSDKKNSHDPIATENPHHQNLSHTIHNRWHHSIPTAWPVTHERFLAILLQNLTPNPKKTSTQNFTGNEEPPCEGLDPKNTWKGNPMPWKNSVQGWQYGGSVRFTTCGWNSGESDWRSRRRKHLPLWYIDRWKIVRVEG